jgi:TonB family protein
MRTADGQKRRSPLGRSVVLAIAIHAQAIAVLAIWAFLTAPRASDLARVAASSEESVGVTTLDDETARRVVAELERQQPPEEQPEPPRPKDTPTPPGQVVELPHPRQERRPEHARFAAEHDSTVEHETQRRATDDRQQPAQAAAPPPAPPPHPSMLAMRSPGEAAPAAPAAPAPPRAPADLSGPGPETKPGPQHQDLPTPEAPGGAPAHPAAPPPQPESQGAPGMDRLLSQQSIQRAMSSGTHDYLRDVDEGEDTALNARSWKFASFFNRVKDQVRQYWKPSAAYRERDPDGNVYGERSRLTMCWVVLKRDGTLAEVKLETPSGLEFLDDVAVEAIKLAQPFPNPPPELIDGSGMIRFKFGFYFEIGMAPRMRVFRYSGL